MKRCTYLFVGDTHNDLAFADRAIELAREQGAEILQVGDWGYLWPGDDKIEELSNALVDNDVTMRFIDGNHDDHPRLRKYVKSCAATTIAPHVIYQPRGSVHEDEDGTRFLFCGGAPSIDRAFRTPSKSWWPEEVITRDELERALTAIGPFHVIVTHDAPSFPPGFSPKGTAAYKKQQEASMRHVDKIVCKHQPEMIVHGHWHIRYERSHPTGARVIGLDCNSASLEDATMLWSRSNEGPVA